MTHICHIYTDGSCDRRDGRGGWGCVIITRPSSMISLSGHANTTTSNRMELEAAIQALNYAFETLSVKEVVLYSDSKYVVQGSTLWLSGWKKRGWKRRKGAVKNQDQWERMAAILEKHGNKTEICWIKGHNGNKYNDLADSLANEARTTRHPLKIKPTHITN